MTRRTRLANRLLASLDAASIDRLIEHYFPGGASGSQYRFTPWLRREMAAGRIVLNDSSVDYLRSVLEWFGWLIHQDPLAVEESTGIPTDDSSWQNVLSYRYSDRGGGLAFLYRDFLRANTALTRQYRNFKQHH